ASTRAGAGACPGCGERVAFRPDGEGEALRAYCQFCGSRGSAAVLHERQVRVIGVLSAEDFKLARTEAPQSWMSPEGTHFFVDDGARLTYVVDLQAASEAASERGGHAGRHIEVLWLADAALDAGFVQQAIFRLVRSTGVDVARQWQ